MRTLLERLIVTMHVNNNISAVDIQIMHIICYPIGLLQHNPKDTEL